jgi:hypothetical protein
VLYIEPLLFEGLKFAILWKIPLLIIITAYLIRKGVAPISFSKLWYWYSLKNILNYGSLSYLKENLILSSKIPIIGLFTHFFNTCFCRNKWDVAKAFNLLCGFNVFIIISCIPFLLGLIEPNGKKYSLEAFGVDSIGFSGVFQGAHPASIVLSITLINLFYILSVSSSIHRRRWIILLILIGLYALYSTYIRTGYLMFLIGCAFFFWKKIFSHKKKYIFFWGIVLTTLGSIYLSQDQVLINRLTDNRIYGDEPSNIGKLGSGRLVFVSTSFNYWMQAPLMMKLFGCGEKMLTENMEEKVGLNVFSHNGFIDAFVQNGLIGLLLFICIMVSFKKYINKIKGHHYYDVCNAIFFMYIGFQFVQGGYYFVTDFIIALNLSIVSLIAHRTQPL